MSPSVLGLIRGIGVAVLFAALTYLGDATHLTGVFTPEIAALVAAVILAIEHSLESSSGKALFGAVKTR